MKVISVVRLLCAVAIFGISAVQSQNGVEDEEINRFLYRDRAFWLGETKSFLEKPGSESFVPSVEIIFTLLNLPKDFIEVEGANRWLNQHQDLVKFFKQHLKNRGIEEVLFSETKDPSRVLEAQTLLTKLFNNNYYSNNKNDVFENILETLIKVSFYYIDRYLNIPELKSFNDLVAHNILDSKVDLKSYTRSTLSVDYNIRPVQKGLYNVLPYSESTDPESFNEPFKMKWYFTYPSRHLTIKSFLFYLGFRSTKKPLHGLGKYNPQNIDVVAKYLYESHYLNLTMVVNEETPEAYNIIKKHGSMNRDEVILRMSDVFNGSTFKLYRIRPTRELFFSLPDIWDNIKKDIQLWNKILTKVMLEMDSNKRKDILTLSLLGKKYDSLVGDDSSRFKEIDMYVDIVLRDPKNFLITSDESLVRALAVIDFFDSSFYGFKELRVYSRVKMRFVESYQDNYRKFFLVNLSQSSVFKNVYPNKIEGWKQLSGLMDLAGIESHGFLWVKSLIEQWNEKHGDKKIDSIPSYKKYFLKGKLPNIDQVIRILNVESKSWNDLFQPAKTSDPFYSEDDNQREVSTERPTLESLVWEMLPQGWLRALEVLPRRLQVWVKSRFAKHIQDVVVKVRSGTSDLPSDMKSMILRVVGPDGKVDLTKLEASDPKLLIGLAESAVKETIEGPMGDGQENREREMAIKEFRQRFKQGLEEGLSGKKLAEQQVEFLLAVWLMDVVKRITHGEMVGEAMSSSMRQVLSYGHLEGLAGFVGASTAVNTLGMLSLRQAINKDIVVRIMARPIMQKVFMNVLGATSLMAGVSAQQVIGKIQGLKAIQAQGVMKYHWMRAYMQMDRQKAGSTGSTPGSVAALYALSKEGGQGRLWEGDPADVRRLMTGFNPDYAQDKLTRSDDVVMYAFLQKLKLQVMNTEDRRIAGLRRFDLREAMTSTMIVLVSGAAARFMTGGMPVVSTMLTLSLVGVLEAEHLNQMNRIRDKSDYDSWKRKREAEGVRLASLVKELPMPLSLSPEYISQSLEPAIEESEIAWMEMQQELMMRGYAAQKAYAEFQGYVQDLLGKRIQRETYQGNDKASALDQENLRRAVEVISGHVESVNQRWETGQALCEAPTTYPTHEYLDDRYDDALTELECSLAALRNQKWRIEYRVKGSGSLKNKLEKILALDEESRSEIDNGARIQAPLQALVQDQYMCLEQMGNQYRDLSIGIRSQMKAFRAVAFIQAAARSVEANTLGSEMKNEYVLVSRVADRAYVDMAVPSKLMSKPYGLKVIVYSQDGKPLHHQTIANRTMYDEYKKRYELKFDLKSSKLEPGKTYWLKVHSLDSPGINNKHDFEINTQIRVPFEQESVN